MSTRVCDTAETSTGKIRKFAQRERARARSRCATEG